MEVAMKRIKKLLRLKTENYKRGHLYNNEGIKQQAASIIESCIECHKCTKECALIEYYGPTPKTLFVPFAEGRLMEPSIPYACHDCGRCNKVCPYQLPMQQVLMAIREEYVKQNGGQSPIKGHIGVRLHQRLSFSSLFSYKKQVEREEVRS